MERKKNCYSCKHLDYYEAYSEEFSESGYSCDGRAYKSWRDEHDHLEKLNTVAGYLNISKRCCELKEALKGKL